MLSFILPSMLPFLCSHLLLLKWLKQRNLSSTTWLSCLPQKAYLTILYYPPLQMDYSTPAPSGFFCQLLPLLFLLTSSLHLCPASAMFVGNPLGNEPWFCAVPLCWEFFLFFLSCLSKFSLSLNVCLSFFFHLAFFYFFGGRKN